MSDAWGARRVMYWVYVSCFITSLLLTIPHLNVWIFTGFIFVMGVMTGVGKAAVYKYIPSYFPHEVGIVGGLVGLIGGLGGFFLPLLFGYLLELTGLWVSCWIFFVFLIAGSLLWMHQVVRRLESQQITKVISEVISG